MAIIVLGDEEDEHSVYMLEHLRERGHHTELIDSQRFPVEIALSYDPHTGDGCIRLAAGRRLPLSSISAVYWRCYNEVATPRLEDPEQSYIAENDSRSLFETVLIGLQARWVNGWEAFRLHQTKPIQLARVAALGVPVPETLLSNDPEEVRRFAAAHPRCIFKPVQGGAHARHLTDAHLSRENLESLAVAPITLQEEIPGTNIRVFVAGERILAAEVRTEALDFRDDEEAEILPASVPREVERWCREVARELRLLWTGIDLRRTPDGRHVFLEANPSPMFMGFEEYTGLPLTAALTDLLVNP